MERQQQKTVNTEFSDELFADLTNMQESVTEDMSATTDALQDQMAALEVELAATAGDDDGTDEFGSYVDDLFGGGDDLDDLFGDGDNLELDDIFGV